MHAEYSYRCTVIAEPVARMHDGCVRYFFLVVLLSAAACGGVEAPAPPDGASVDSGIVDAAGGDSDAAMAAQIVCQIGSTGADAQACSGLGFEWVDSLDGIEPCSVPCSVGAPCHVPGGEFGSVTQDGECTTAQSGAEQCDASIPWVWVDGNGEHACSVPAPVDAQCWQVVHGFCEPN